MNMPTAVLDRGPETGEIRRLREDAGPGNPEACYALGLALQAMGTPASEQEALHWFAIATMAEHSGGHYQMGLYYRATADKQMASYHMEAAAFQGFEPAVKMVREWKVEGYLDFADDDEAIQLLEEGAARGISEARYQLADRISHGRGAEPNPQRVAKLYRQAAEAGHRGGMYKLARCYHLGYGVPADGSAAMRWYNQAAEKGQPDAWLALGTVHRGSGRHADAVRCFTRAAELGSTDALFALALAHGRGEGFPQNDAEMRRLTARAAEAGHTESQYWLANYYRYGEGEFAQDLERAAHWYERASFADHPAATYCFGLCTLLGHGAEQDIEKGWDLIEKGAKMGVVDAMMCMATMIDSGQAPVDDPESALYWYQQAADKGNADAQFTAGKRMLEMPNEKRFARDYLKKAAAQGHAQATALLESLPEEPRSVPPDNSGDLPKAIAGDPRSQYQLGFALFMGMGVEKNLPLSYFWFKVLSRTMPPQAAQMLQLLSTQVPPATRESLDRLAMEWAPGTPPPSLS